MKQTFTFLTLLLLTNFCVAQASFSDDFESYSVGDYISSASSDWTTWDNAPGTSTDAQVSDDYAASGNNSLKIFATNSGGGPMDILLPFKGTYNSGRFIQSMKLYLPEGKNAYFNYQETATPGQVWTLNGWLRADGSFELTNSDNDAVFTSTYTQGEWLDLAIEINLDAQIWKVWMNGECMGSFSNGVNRVSSLNLYPVDGDSEFYVDDISFEYEVDAPEINNDIGITNLSYNGGRLTGNQGNLSYVLTNNGKNEITEVVLSIDVNGTQEEKTLSGLSLAAGQSTTVQLDNPVTMVNGQNNINIGLVSVNGENGDDETCNNEGTFTATAVTPAPGKRIVVEEATGTWCQWCPRGAVFLERMKEMYGDLFIGIAVHNGDPMTVSEHDSYVTSRPGFGGFPGIFYNRSFATGIPNIGSMENPFLNDIQSAPDATAEIGATYDDSSREMIVETTVNFINDIDDDVHVNFILIEDGVRGTESGYAQSNAYAGGGAGVMGGYELLPHPVPASQMVYDHVSRAFIGIDAEDYNTMSGPSSTNDSKSVRFSHTVANGQDVNNMYLVAIIMKGDEYVNAEEVSFEDAITKGINSTNITQILNNVKTFPVPTNDIVNFELELEKSSPVSIQIYNSAGSLVGEANHGTLQGLYKIPVNVSMLNEGMYRALITTNQGISTQSFSVVK